MKSRTIRVYVEPQKDGSLFISPVSGKLSKIIMDRTNRDDPWIELEDSNEVWDTINRDQYFKLKSGETIVLLMKYPSILSEWGLPMKDIF